MTPSTPSLTEAAPFRRRFSSGRRPVHSGGPAFFFVAAGLVQAPSEDINNQETFKRTLRYIVSTSKIRTMLEE